jgi:hypothetical protein
VSAPDEPRVLLIFGPIAVGKMTVGQELARITDFHLLHAHMVIDLVTPLFPFGTEAFSRLAREIRSGFIREAAGSGQSLILTHIWNFDDPGTAEGIAQLDAHVTECGARLYFAELQAPLSIRLERNDTPNRRASKDVAWATREYLTDWDERHRTSSDGCFPYPDRHVLVDNSKLTAEQAAQQIKTHFDLT